MEERDVRRYLRHPWKCPVCHSSDINANCQLHFRDCGTEAVQDVSCSSCGASWIDVYKLSGIIPAGEQAITPAPRIVLIEDEGVIQEIVGEAPVGVFHVNFCKDDVESNEIDIRNGDINSGPTETLCGRPCIVSDRWDADTRTAANVTQTCDQIEEGKGYDC